MSFDVVKGYYIANIAYFSIGCARGYCFYIKINNSDICPVLCSDFSFLHRGYGRVCKWLTASGLAVLPVLQCETAGFAGQDGSSCAS